ncbi:MAG: hypothetical protein ACLTKI_00275 [Lachnospiraceae bacterium]
MRKLLLLLSCTLVLMSGCTKSNIVSPDGPVEPDFNIKDNVELDMEQMQDVLDEQFVQTEDYPFGQAIEFYIDEKDTSLYLMITVDDDTDPEAAAAYGMEIIDAFNDEAATQDFSYEPSSDDSYGGFSDNYHVWIQIMPESTKEDETTWLVDDNIPAGTNYMVEPREAVTAENQE